MNLLIVIGAIWLALNLYAIWLGYRWHGVAQSEKPARSAQIISLAEHRRRAA